MKKLALARVPAPDYPILVFFNGLLQVEGPDNDYEVGHHVPQSVAASATFFVEFVRPRQPWDRVTIVYASRGPHGRGRLTTHREDFQEPESKTCPAVLNIKGEQFNCDWSTDADGTHKGWGHTNKKAGALWTDDKDNL